MLATIGATLCLVSAVASEAPAVPEVLTLQESLSLFRERGFDLLIADVNIRAAEGDVLSAQAIPNPAAMVGFSKSFGYDPAEAGRGASSVGWITQIGDQAAFFNSLIVGKRGLRRDVARAALESARLGRNDAERVLGLSVKQQFAAVAAAQLALDVARRVEETYNEAVELVQARLRAGVVSESDVARARTAALNAAQMVDLATQSLQEARASLAFLLGVRGLTPAFQVDTSLFNAVPARELEEASPEALTTQARKLRPDLQAGRREIERARALVALNKRERIPDISLSLQYIQIGTGQVAIQPPTLTFMVGAPLPLFYRNQGEILRSEAELRIQDVALTRLEAQVSVDVGVGWAAFVAARNRLKRFRSGLIEQATLARDLSRIQYEKGAASLLEFLDAQRSYVTAQGDYIQALNDFWNAVFLLEAAVGTEFH